MSVGIGDRAPEFTLPGTGEREYSLSEFLGRPIVLVFYPGDDTPVCTKQLNAYNDDLDQFEALDAQVILARFLGMRVAAWHMHGPVAKAISAACRWNRALAKRSRHPA